MDWEAFRWFVLGAELSRLEWERKERRRGRARLVELKTEKDVRLARALIEKYHSMGLPPGSGGGRGSRYFAWVVGGYICAVAWLHDSTPFRSIAEKLGIPSEGSYFVRRLCETCPGDHLAPFLAALARKLKSEGAQLIWTFGLDDRTNTAYKRAGFTEAGKTPRTQRPVYILPLR